VVQKYTAVVASLAKTTEHQWPPQSLPVVCLSLHRTTLLTITTIKPLPENIYLSSLYCHSQIENVGKFKKMKINDE